MRISRVLAAALALTASLSAWGAELAETCLKDHGPVPGGGVAFADPSTSLVPSPDGMRLAYVAADPKQQGRWRVICDGKPGPSFEEVYGSRLTFSPDGKRLAYVARTGQEWALLIDDKPLRNGTSFVFSPDGKRLAWVASVANSNYDLMMNDAKLATRSHPISELTFSPDSRRFAYVFLNSKIEGRYIWLRPMLTVDGNTGRSVHEVIEGVTFSPDSKHWAAAVRDDKRWRILLDDKELPLCDEVLAPVFAPSGLHLAYPARSGVNWYMVRDSKAGPKYDKAGLPVFSPDAKHLAHFAARGRAFAVVCDDRETGEYDAVDWIAFSPDGKHLAWSARRGDDCFIVCDGREGLPHAQVIVPARAADVPDKLRYVVVDDDKASGKRKASLVQIDWPTDGKWEDAFAGTP